MKHTTHTQRLERWIGSEALQALHEASRDLTIPIPVLNVPGNIISYRGEFFGAIRGGGFASLSDLINEVTVNGKGQFWIFVKASSFGGAAAWSSLWNVGTFPYAGGAPAAIPGGAVPVNTTTGALPFTNATGGDTMHFINGQVSVSTGVPATLLLYDRIFHAGSVQHNTTGNQSVSGVPNRYDTTGTAPGNFAFLEITTILGSTAHTLTMTYVDDAGHGAEAASALAMQTTAAVTRIPHVPFFVPLNANDLGVTNVTNIAFSAVSSGVSNIVIGHPIAFIPSFVNNQLVLVDSINTTFNLIRIYDSACLSFIQLNGAAATWTGLIYVATG